MNKTLLIVIIVVLALALGIGGGFAVSKALPAPPAQDSGEESSGLPQPPEPFTLVTPAPSDEDEDDDDEDGIPLPTLDPRWLEKGERPDPMKRFDQQLEKRGWMEKGFIPPGLLKKNSDWPDEWRYWGPGGMGPWGDDFEVTGERITLEQALALAQDYIADHTENLRITRVYEFANLFYAFVEETDTGMGAFQLIIQPVSGKVRQENGPSFNWNTKYGRHAKQGGESVENALTLDAAAAQAQQVLNDQSAEATIDPAGTAFHGYYTFEYLVDGEVAGLLSVNAADGDFWFHNWLGELISKKDIVE